MKEDALMVMYALTFRHLRCHQQRLGRTYYKNKGRSEILGNYIIGSDGIKVLFPQKMRYRVSDKSQITNVSGVEAE